jgi:MoxR-like ATPase
LQPVFTKEEVMAFQKLVRRVPVSKHVLNYAVDLARASRPNEQGARDFVKKYVEWGAGPRASQYLVLGAKALSLLRGKPAPSTEDVREVARAVLQHRIIPNYNATGEGVGVDQIVAGLIKNVPEADYRQ